MCRPANPHHDFGLNKQEVSHLPSETTFLHFFFLNDKRKMYCKQCWVENSNDNYSRDSHLEETEYTGNYYTPVICELGIYPMIYLLK